ncbi:hypothetical protein ACFY00_23815 [Kitasatospora sp. NPDC001540]|uniref:hypothetical protein n=1 Tax=Kitasatospora sp. NPDC001540 TaxID=3364014 RepID=UPI0036B7232B
MSSEKDQHPHNLPTTAWQMTQKIIATVVARLAVGAIEETYLDDADSEPERGN